MTTLTREDLTTPATADSGTSNAVDKPQAPALSQERRVKGGKVAVVITDPRVEIGGERQEVGTTVLVWPDQADRLVKKKRAKRK